MSYVSDMSHFEGPDDHLKGPVRLAALAFALLLTIGGLWATKTMISGAVISSGQVMVKGEAQKLQSLEGGTVAGILVKNGDHVRAGQILVRFDATLVATNLNIARARLAGALALRARLLAEQAGLATPLFDLPTLPFAAPDIRAEAEGQRQIFVARAAVLTGQRDRLAETLAQLDSQKQSIAAQLATKAEEISLTDDQIANQQVLLDQGLTRQSQLSDLRRGHASLLGQLAALQAEASKLITAGRDAQLETLQGERAFQEKVAIDLREAEAKIEELMLEILTRQQQLAQMDLRAPQAGVVHELKLSTIGGIVAPGDTVAEVIPLAAGLHFEVQVDPHGIDEVFIGQKGEVSFASLDPRSTPKLQATVAAISPDAIIDPRSGRSYYRVDLTLPDAEIARLDGQTLLPGMPVTAYLVTSSRSVLAYLMHPLISQMDLAFREP
ncbi:MAG: HlyD family type I secretion periplasmic adaptor subunit [Cypionkella sp.]